MNREVVIEEVDSLKKFICTWFKYMGKRRRKSGQSRRFYLRLVNKSSEALKVILELFFMRSTLLLVCVFMMAIIPVTNAQPNVSIIIDWNGTLLQSPWCELRW